MTKIKRLSRRYQAYRKVKTKRFTVLRGHPFVVPVITFLALFFTTTIGLILLNGQTVAPSDSRTILLSVDGVERTVPTRAATVKDLIAKLEIPVGKNDIVTPAPSTQILGDNFKVSIKKARPVTIEDSGHRITILSAEQQPRVVVAQAGIKLQTEDVVESTQPIDATREAVIGQKVVVNRAKAANINLYGSAFTVYTRAKTVGELLDQKGINLSKGDTLQPSRNTKLTSNTQIFVVRVGKQIISEEIAIPAPVITEDDPTLVSGAIIVKEPGADGKKVVTYEVELKNGVEVSRKAIQEIVVSSPTNKVVKRGKAQPNSGDIVGQITYWANHYGISSDYLLKIARCESTLNPAALGPPDYYGVRPTGLFQYKPSTWASYSASAGIPGASIYDPAAQAQTTAWAFANGRSSAWECH